jgi:DNA repair exonuclease SbcCD ATPase subunit
MTKGWTIETIRKYFNNKLKALSRALKLQAKEYKRRLKDLNGEAARLRGIQEQYIPREVFDRVVDELRKEIKILTDYKIKQEGKSDLLKFVPWVLTAISIILLYTKK